MKDKILRLALCLTCLGGSVSHAEWIDSKDFEEVTETEEVIEFLKEMNRQFFIPANKSKSGVHISAFDAEYLNEIVDLRYKDDIIDCKLIINSPINKVSCDIYLNLLDDNKFLIKTVKLDYLNKEFIGNVYSSFNMKWGAFKNIKYYSLHIRY